MNFGVKCLRAGKTTLVVGLRVGKDCAKVAQLGAHVGGTIAVGFAMVKSAQFVARTWRAFCITSKMRALANRRIESIQPDELFLDSDEETEDVDLQGVTELEGGRRFAAVNSEGMPGELAPECPPMKELLGFRTVGVTRRMRRFMKYWVDRVHEDYPRVVGDWSKPSLACTRRHLVKIMREPRIYYIQARVPGGDMKMVKMFKAGMHTHQISSCVDWIVSLAHAGTAAQHVQEAVICQLKPNWFMRLFGLTDSPGMGA